MTGDKRRGVWMPLAELEAMAEEHGLGTPVRNDERRRFTVTWNGTFYNAHMEEA